MHYRIFSILVTAFLLISCLPTAFAQDNQSEKPVVLYGTPKKYEIADIKVEGAENYEDYVIINLSGLSKGQLITIPGDEITQACKRYWRHGLFSDCFYHIRQGGRRQGMAHHPRGHASACIGNPFPWRQEV